MHHVYFIPGMFGFGKLAGYDYFNHVRLGLEQRFADAGAKVRFEDVPSPPTASLRHRAHVLASTISRTCGTGQGPIHLIGHSTGGLDARLILSPNTTLSGAMEAQFWLPRVRTAISINTPHYGTPLAGYFATVSGTRVLYALSLMTIVSLYVGEPSLAIFSRVLAGIGSIDSLLGGDLKLISRTTDMVLRFVDKDSRAEINRYLRKIRVDQGAVIQTMPESMDLFNTTTIDNSEVRYGSIVSAAPPPRSMRIARRLRSPYAAFTAALYTTLYQFTSQKPKSYGYAQPSVSQAQTMRNGTSHDMSEADNDGIVPTLSMLWGRLVWAGEADHLDVLGHFHDDVRPTDHVDWITSGSHFTRQRFAAMLDGIAGFQLDAAPAKR